MAVRRNSEMPSMVTTPDEIIEALTEFGATEAKPMPLKEIALAVADSPEATWDVLSAMEDAGTVDLTGRHLNSSWWLVEASEKVSVPAPKPAPKSKAPAKVEEEKPAQPVKRTRRTKAQIEVDNAAAAKDTDRFGHTPDEVGYGATEIELEEMETQGVDTHEKKSEPLFRPAPDALPKGTVITLESGAEATVIADEVITVKTPAVSQIPALKLLVQKLKEKHAEASNVRDGYEPPEEVTKLPLEPHGVNENTWNALHNAYGVSDRDTLSARLFYAERALSQHTEALAKLW